jgi:hypothetical protein
MPRWRVRVKRTIEDWVEISASTKPEAEKAASTMAGVVAVLPGMTISGEKPSGYMIPIGIEDDDE